MPPSTEQPIMQAIIRNAVIGLTVFGSFAMGGLAARAGEADIGIAQLKQATVPDAAPVPLPPRKSIAAKKSATGDKAEEPDTTPPASAAGGYRELVQRHASVHGLPFALADAVVMIESGYNPNARHNGAIGLMQIMLPTARSVGYAGDAAGLTKPETNIKYGMIYLAQAYRLSGGDTCKTVMRYQTGHLTDRMSAANQAYCSKARVIIAQNSE
jgi:soluble lytic murein transglycosylase-like protein